jgi:hypothetical protein
MAAVNFMERANIPSLAPGKGLYLVHLTSTADGGSTAISAAGDVTFTFDKAFSAAPKVISTAFSSATAGAAGTYPTAWVKSVSTTAIVVALGGAVGTLSAPEITVMLEGAV